MVAGTASRLTTGIKLGCNHQIFESRMLLLLADSDARGRGGPVEFQRGPTRSRLSRDMVNCSVGLALLETFMSTRAKSSFSS